MSGGETVLNDMYVLPELDFIAGETQTINFHLYFLHSKEEFNANSCKVNLSIVDYTNKHGKPLVSKRCEILLNTSGVANIAKAYLLPEDTAGLYGKYVYQLQLRDIDDEVEIPGQGIMNIGKNLNKGFIYTGQFATEK